MEQKRADALSRRIYSDAQHEWERLVEKPSNWLELETTLLYMKRFLPKKGKVLDAGGGPGRYSIYLAKHGYRPTLFDLSAKHVAFAEKQAKAEKVVGRFDGFEVGSILDLSRFPSSTFDSVLCLGGPLSHISSEGGRLKALSELVRVAKKNSPIFVSVMGKWGTLASAPLWSMKSSIAEIRLTRRIMDLATKGEDTMWRGRHYAHFFTLNEMRTLFSKIENAKVLKSVGLQGLSATWSDEYVRKLAKDERAWDNWLRVNSIAREVSAVVDTSRHFMIVARKTK
ncbi:MAG: class I SAM-dependent methyltransferase [Candidatus Marsarchaeota archaeon]|nr:class I SAM-dependent methyltransferase [Candidatus Marsarchaeota archaeon]